MLYQSEGLKFESWCALDDEELVSSSPVDGGTPQSSSAFNSATLHLQP
jgi:hypothetical protein